MSHIWATGHSSHFGMFCVVKFTRECVWCTVHRMMSQNQLWTNGYRDSRLDKWVQATNLEVEDHWKEWRSMVCCRHQQTHWSIWKIPGSVWWLCRKVGLWSGEKSIFPFEVHLLIFTEKGSVVQNFWSTPGIGWVSGKRFLNW